jgi:hypothetical protein
VTTGDFGIASPSLEGLAMTVWGNQMKTPSPTGEGGGGGATCAFAKPMELWADASVLLLPSPLDTRSPEVFQRGTVRRRQGRNARDR